MTDLQPQLKLEVGHTYRTRAGALVEITESPEGDPLFHGTVFRSGIIQLSRSCWHASGQKFTNRDSVNDLIEACEPPYTTWMCKVGSQPPMPAPNEQVAREWARRSNGRAFRVLEIIE
jgi:hypothetical protein